MARRTRRTWGSVHKLPSGRYRARYTGPDGRPHTAPHTFTAKMDAEGWLANEDRLISRGEWTPPKQRARAEEAQALTFGEYAARVLDARARRTKKPLRLTTLDLYRKLLRLALLPTFADMPLADIAPEDVVKWHASLPDRPTQNANAYLLLKSIMVDAEDEELIARNPCRLKGAGKPEPARTAEALTVTELTAYLEAVPERYRVALMLAGWCGLRSGEVRALRRRDLDLRQGVVNVERTVSRVTDDEGGHRWHIGPPKTRAGVRTVAIPPHLLDVLAEWLAAQPVRGKDGLLFPADDGATPLHDTVLRDAHKHGATAIGRPTLTVHDLRRTAATLSAQAGATTKELMRLLGHTTVDVAMKYQVPDDERDMERARRVSERATRAE